MRPGGRAVVDLAVAVVALAVAVGVPVVACSSPPNVVVQNRRAEAVHVFYRADDEIHEHDLGFVNSRGGVRGASVVRRGAGIHVRATSSVGDRPVDTFRPWPDDPRQELVVVIDE
jgi:hypothetical protein